MQSTSAFGQQPLRWTTLLSSIPENQKKFICEKIAPYIEEISCSSVFQYSTLDYKVLTTEDASPISAAKKFFEGEATKQNPRKLGDLYLALKKTKKDHVIADIFNENFEPQKLKLLVNIKLKELLKLEDYNNFKKLFLRNYANKPFVNFAACGHINAPFNLDQWLDDCILLDLIGFFNFYEISNSDHNLNFNINQYFIPNMPMNQPNLFQNSDTPINYLYRALEKNNQIRCSFAKFSNYLRNNANQIYGEVLSSMDIIFREYNFSPNHLNTPLSQALSIDIFKNLDINEEKCKKIFINMIKTFPFIKECFIFMTQNRNLSKITNYQLFLKLLNPINQESYQSNFIQNIFQNPISAQFATLENVRNKITFGIFFTGLIKLGDIPLTKNLMRALRQSPRSIFKQEVPLPYVQTEADFKLTETILTLSVKNFIPFINELFQIHEVNFSDLKKHVSEDLKNELRTLSQSYSNATEMFQQLMLSKNFTIRKLFECLKKARMDAIINSLKTVVIHINFENFLDSGIDINALKKITNLPVNSLTSQYLQILETLTAHRIEYKILFKHYRAIATKEDKIKIAEFSQYSTDNNNMMEMILKSDFFTIHKLIWSLALMDKNETITAINNIIFS